MQSGSGIQELMAAETRASQIVAEARIGKSTNRFVHAAMSSLLRVVRSGRDNHDAAASSTECYRLDTD